MHNLWIVALSVLLLNLPFGFWRAGVRKFSLHWFLAVHIPIPFVVCIRILAGIGLHFTTFLVLISTFLIGQFLGGKLRYLYQKGL